MKENRWLSFLAADGIPRHFSRINPRRSLLAAVGNRAFFLFFSFFARNIYQRRQLPRGVVYLLERNELAVKLIYLMMFVIDAN